MAGRSTRLLFGGGSGICSSRVLLPLLLLLLGGSLLILHRVSRSPLLNQYGILKTHLERHPPTTSPTRTILLWNEFFGDPRWKLSWDTLGPLELREELRCPEHRCVVTNQHDFLPSPELYDAIVFHAAEMYPLVAPTPALRSPRQLYVFALMEPPGETKHRLDDEGGFYNLTMSYRLDSDVVWPYGQVSDADTDAPVAPSRWPHWRQPPIAFNDSTVWELWAGKSRMAAWFVSHCETLSKRERLAEQLQDYFSVDIYGKCGSLSCARGDPHCEEMLDTDYMFYLAFENALCDDYVTEKLYNALRRNIIPVVFGGADYARILPPHSYIDANRFETVAELALHMRYVAGDPAEYVSYFWWRPHYRLTSSSPFCDLCSRLHDPSFTHRSQVYEDIQGWWFGGCRLKSNIEL